MKTAVGILRCFAPACVMFAVGCQSEEPAIMTTTAQIKQLRPLMTEAQVVSIVGPCKFDLLIFDRPGPAGYSFKFCDYSTEADTWSVRITADDKLESVCSSGSNVCLVDTRPPLVTP